MIIFIIVTIRSEFILFAIYFYASVIYKFILFVILNVIFTLLLSSSFSPLFVFLQGCFFLSLKILKFHRIVFTLLLLADAVIKMIFLLYIVNHQNSQTLALRLQEINHNFRI
jgi:hypothetical protein